MNNQVTELDSLGRALAAAEPVIKMNFNMFFFEIRISDDQVLEANRQETNHILCVSFFFTARSLE